MQLRIRLADQEKKYDQLRNEVQQLDKNCRRASAVAHCLQHELCSHLHLWVPGCATASAPILQDSLDAKPL